MVIARTKLGLDCEPCQEFPMPMRLFTKATQQLLITGFARVMLEGPSTVGPLQPRPASASPNGIYGEQDDHE